SLGRQDGDSMSGTPARSGSAARSSTSPVSLPMSSRLASVASRLASTTASSSSIRARRVTGAASRTSAPGAAAAGGSATARGGGAGAGTAADLAPSSATTLRLYSLISASTDAGGFAQALSVAG